MASGDVLLTLSPLAATSPASNGALHDSRNGHPVLDFDDGTNEDTIFGNLVMPATYGGGGVTVYIYYAMTTATTGDIDWDVAFERVADSIQDIDSDGFAAAQSVDNTTVPGTSGHVDVVSVAFTDGTQMGSVTTDDGFRLKVTRDAVSDTASGDAELWGLRIEET